MPVPSEWIEHRRGDRELVGWLRPEGHGFVAIDLLGRPVTGVVDWLEGEETLEAHGIGYLADPYELRLDDGHWLRVRITEVSTDAIRVKKEDWGDMTATHIDYTVPFPLPEQLRPHRPAR
ncbi:hypothetical protein ACFVWR_12095 [Leifsonia sp. NPDC058292]|uniref:hypothetical protein n=1 Tax=Leifsonia sp. NPDC058292 TaxID=3346428 RepID=UPI0036DA7C39